MIRKTLFLGSFGKELIKAFNATVLYAVLQELLNNPFVHNEKNYVSIITAMGFSEFDATIWICEGAPELERLRNDVRTLSANYAICSWANTDTIIIFEVEPIGNQNL